MFQASKADATFFPVFNKKMNSYVHQSAQVMRSMDPLLDVFLFFMGFWMIFEETIYEGLEQELINSFIILFLGKLDLTHLPVFYGKKVVVHWVGTQYSQANKIN